MLTLLPFFAVLVHCDRPRDGPSRLLCRQLLRRKALPTFPRRQFPADADLRLVGPDL